MKKINKDISIKLSFGIFSAIGFVAGILLIIFGAGKSAIMLTAGIILGINGFYGTPLWFISYGETKAIKRVVYAIEKEKIYSVKDIATQLHLAKGYKVSLKGKEVLICRFLTTLHSALRQNCGA